MKKSIFKAFLIVLIFIISAVSCSGQSSGQTINSPEALKTYLDRQPANSPEKPIRVSMTINDPMLENVADVIKSSGKYVSLNITGDLLKTIGEGVFMRCETLVSVTIPNGVTSIGNAAFYNCTNLASVTIGNSVTEIGPEVFLSCTRLASITIPDSVTSIRNRAFKDTAWLNNQPDGMVYAGKVAYIYKGTMPENTSITIVDGTKGIAGAAFQYCEKLISITIPNSVTNIKPWAFDGCTGLTSVTFQGTIKSDNFDDTSFRDGDLRNKYLAGGIGTYTREKGSRTWTKQ